MPTPPDSYHGFDLTGLSHDDEKSAVVTAIDRILETRIGKYVVDLIETQPQDTYGIIFDYDSAIGAETHATGYSASADKIRINIYQLVNTKYFDPDGQINQSSSGHEGNQAGHTHSWSLSELIFHEILHLIDTEFISKTETVNQAFYDEHYTGLASNKIQTTYEATNQFRSLFEESQGVQKAPRDTDNIDSLVIASSPVTGETDLRNAISNFQLSSPTITFSEGDPVDPFFLESFVLPLWNDQTLSQDMRDLVEEALSEFDEQGDTTTPTTTSGLNYTAPSDYYVGDSSNNGLIEFGEGNDLALGHAGDDDFDGEEGHDLLFGGADNDTLKGGSGNDILNGGDGNDELHGDADADQLYGGSGADELFGGEGNDGLTGGDGNDRLFGNDGVDVLVGNDGDDRIFGGDDDDIIQGGKGDDYLKGGSGDDTYHYADGDGFDIIVDGPNLGGVGGGGGGGGSSSDTNTVELESPPPDTDGDGQFSAGDVNVTNIGAGGAVYEFGDGTQIVAQDPNATPGTTTTPIGQFRVGPDGPTVTMPEMPVRPPEPPELFNLDDIPFLIKPPILLDSKKVWDLAEGTGVNPGTPLILDMDGDGIELVSLEDSAAYFDLGARDYADRTAWTVEGEDDAFLAVDSNNNGRIDDTDELFGNATTDGFTILAAFDTNADDLITAADDDFDDLLVWHDADGDGFTDDGELQTLSAAGITSIDVDPTLVSYEIAGNEVTHESTFTINGQTRDVIDVWFEHDAMDTFYVGDNWEFDEDNEVLPLLQGYGTLANTLHATSVDSDFYDDFKSLVDNYGNLGEFSNFTANLSDFMFQWAGVEGVSPTGRGQYVDGQELAFLEALMGQAYENPYGGNDPTFQNNGDVLTSMFDGMQAEYALRIMAQTDDNLKEVLNYNFHHDAVLISAVSTTELDNNEPVDSHDAALYWLFLSRAVGTPDLMAHIADQVAANESEYTTAELEFFNVTIGTTSGESVAIDDNFSSGVIVADDGDDGLTGYWGNDVLFGGGGADNLDGRSGDDTLFGGLGDDTLRGKDGDDTYVFLEGDGVDTIEEDSGGYDSIYFGDTIAPDDVSYARDSDDLVITVGTGGDEITVQDFFLDSNKAIEEVVFSDGTVHEYDYLLAIANLQNGTSGNETLYGSNDIDDIIYGHEGDDWLIGYTGNDWLYGGADDDRLDGYDGADHLFGGFGVDQIYGHDGDDYIEAGAGNDTSINGGNGDDTYVFNVGDGYDYIIDSGGYDTLILGPGIDPGDVSYTKVGYHLELTIGAGGDKVRLTNAVGGSSWDTRKIEEIVFDDGTIHDVDYMHQQVYVSLGDANNNTLNGTFNFGDSMYGFEGNDTLKGFSGNDYIEGGDGDDTILGYQGRDEIYGGNGADDIDGAENKDTIYGGAGDDIIDGGDQDDLIYGEADNDDIDGGAGTDTLYGGAGADDLLGGGGHDRLYGDDGDDTLDGEAGYDRLYGGGGDDTIVYDSVDAWISGGSGIDTILADGLNTISRYQADGIEIVDMTDSAGDDGATLHYQDVLAIADDATMQFRGDSGDEVTVNGDTFTRGTDQVIDSLTFAHFTGDSSAAEVLVQVGLDFNGSEVTV